MKILSIETSCDESAAACVSFEKRDDSDNKVPYTLHATTLISQADIHTKYGGVYPTLAKRSHIENTPLVIKETLERSNLCEKEDRVYDPAFDEIFEKTDGKKQFITHLLPLKKPKGLTHIAVTIGPGLAPALWVGVTYARALQKLWDIPVIPVNHMEGHIVSSFIQENPGILTLPDNPFLSLLVSGGHTELVYSERIGEYKKIGATKDDAVGEAFDKVARMLGLPYPGGPEISLRAKKVREKGEEDAYLFPRPLLRDTTFNFSYSGLKTAVRYTIEKKETVSEEDINRIAFSFENAAIEVLIEKTKKALLEYTPRTLIIGGGVSANEHLRSQITSLAKECTTTLFLPKKEMTTDNAVMIAIAAYFNTPLAESTTLNAYSNLSL